MMKTGFTYWYLLLFVWFAVSCGNKKTLTANEYGSWMKEESNGLTKTKSVSEYTFKVTFDPVEWLIAKEYKNELTPPVLDSVKEVYDRTVHITMNAGSADATQPLLRANLADETEYFTRLQYYTSTVQQDLYLVEGADTLPCVFYHFEQSFNLTPTNSMVMEFERRSNATFDDMWLIYEDHVLNIGILKFHFTKKALNSIPKLVI